MSEQDAATILLIDDHPMLRTGVKQLISMDSNLKVIAEASNGEQGVRLAEELDPDLILLDLNMPGMNGIELIREVRKLPAYKFMPILFLTTESQQSRKMEAKAAGASGWIVKPATADELLNTIKLVLR